ncbi:hypothetical protein phiPsa267_036 [Pseudomonas phage phiPsa267]|uniref:Uncharacterized protein n=7 Tax=Otagovirus TaxID=2560197 RepID=A0A7G9V130_9CAUD|nr:hypothetical protein CF96_gp034 [Pseudomonas phage phiPsa374]YP_010767125.1 hypothetical protein QGX16_gp035 [Pseudomonas phage phiPsa397]YP_010767297.1 hypothetical protein QGX17_gp034 [Pseudomonas phage phiPsa381]YP_010767473.1 hypothetical protein QGX18_gp037 [Pseudomonas phage phiPsa347]YP_010767646.1 hypothetical protein QGX19_gp036 [Pseudomonas phage phiPsa267]YP_010767820.1 hypothetical protein QGX20_gp034 [Pseudomonas phage phiPsa300]YP_010767994.1 hypothetical protein QGX21_gp037 
MAKLTVVTDFKEQVDVVPGTLMIHKEPPAYIVMATGIVIGDEFPGVALSDGSYGDQWVIDQYNIFEGTLTLEQ